MATVTIWMVQVFLHSIRLSLKQPMDPIVHKKMTQAKIQSKERSK